MQLIKKISIDINKKTYQEIKAKQNDIGRFIEFSLYADGVSLNITNNTVKIFGKKSDGTIIFNNLTVTDAVKGIVLAELTSQALARSGNLEAELVIYGADGTEISSIPFVIVVEKSIRDDSAIESQNEFTALSEAMQSLAEYDTYKQKVTDLDLEKLDKDGDSKDNTTTFTIAATEADIVSGEKHSTTFGKILKSIKTFRNAIGVIASLSTVEKSNLVGAINELASGKINTTDITQTAETNSVTKVASSAVTNALHVKLTETTNNLASVTKASSPVATAVPTATATALISVNLPAGTYIIFGEATFPPNISGYRRLYIRDSVRDIGTIHVPTTATGYVALSASCVMTLTNDTTVSLYAMQDSGVSLNVVAGAVINAVRLK